MSKAPCYGCERRQVGCHDEKTCEDWRLFLEKQNRRRAAEQNQRILEETLITGARRVKEKLDRI